MAVQLDSYNLNHVYVGVFIIPYLCKFYDMIAHFLLCLPHLVSPNHSPFLFALFPSVVLLAERKITL